MKVLFVASYSGTSGANQSLIALIKILKTKGVDPIVLLPTEGKLEQMLLENNIPYKKMRLFNWITPIKNHYTKKEKVKWLLKDIINLMQEFRILSLIKQEKVDLVHINAITASWGYYAAIKNKIPVVWHIREFLEEDLNKKFWNRNKALKKIETVDRIITISKSVNKKYSKFISNDNLITIYNGIDHVKYKGIYNDIFKRENIIMTISGRIVQEKGHEEVIYAINQLVESNITNIKLQIVGDEGDANFITRIKSLVDELNLNNYVFFLGYRTDMINIWSESDIAIVSSKAEAFGRVTIEAMMAGTLVLGANTEGTAELIGDRYGLIYEQGNYKSLSERILYAMNNKTKMKEVAKEARNYANENFTADLNAENIYRVYENSLNTILT